MTRRLPQKADMVISVNSLDHSGDIKKSVNNIASSIKEGGIFHMHVHRTKAQLNKSHRMLIREKEFDNVFVQYSVINKKIYNTCPFDNKEYRSYTISVKI